MKSDKIKSFVNETYLNEKLRLAQYLLTPRKIGKRLSKTSKWRFDKSLRSKSISGRKKHYAISTKLAAAKLI